jgi:hypothetical protein
MGDTLDDFAVDVLCELHCSLSATRRAHPSALAGESDKKGVLAPIAIHAGSSVSEDAAVKVLIVGLHDLIP